MSNKTGVEATEYFAMFGLQPSFLIDSKALAATYRELAKDVHPDRFAGAAAATQREAVERAARLNDAFQTLKSPTQRALYLLRQQAELPEETTIQDGEFLFRKWNGVNMETCKNDSVDDRELCGKLQQARNALTLLWV